MGLSVLEIKDGIGILLINRPSALNALNREVLEEIDSALHRICNGKIFDGETCDGEISSEEICSEEIYSKEVSNEEAFSNEVSHDEISSEEVSRGGAVRALIISGQGSKAFVAGADIAAMENMTCEEAQDFCNFGQEIFTRLETLPIPTIAAVNGYALGGGNELAMACDIRIAAANAKFGQPEANLGIIPGFGGTQRLSRIVGPKKALELLMSGRVIDAEEALRIGLVNEVVPQGEALKKAEELAAELAKKPSRVISAIKEAVMKGYGVSLKEALGVERTLFAACFSRSDQKEGMRAFLEKRPPKFS